MYEAARKHMYTAMERESSDHPAARRGFEQALAGFSEFMAAAAKNRGMYRELVLPANLTWPPPVSCPLLMPGI